MNGQTQSCVDSERCFGDLHRWRPYIGDPVAESFWIGQRCYCGTMTWEQCGCECGHKHLKQVRVDTGASLFGTHIQEAVDAWKRIVS